MQSTCKCLDGLQMNRHSYDYSGVAALLRYSLLREAFLAKNKWRRFCRQRPAHCNSNRRSIVDQETSANSGMFIYCFYMGLSINGGYPQMDGFFFVNLLKWMITRVFFSIHGNPHMLDHWDASRLGLDPVMNNWMHPWSGALDGLKKTLLVENSPINIHGWPVKWLKSGCFLPIFGHSHARISCSLMIIIGHVQSLRNSGWCFGTFFIFPSIGNNHPNWLMFFQRGWNHQPEFVVSSLTRNPLCCWKNTCFDCTKIQHVAESGGLIWQPTAAGSRWCGFESDAVKRC